MEESFTDVDDWRSIIDLSEDGLGQIFETEEESFFKKVEDFRLDLNSDISGPGMWFKECLNRVFLRQVSCYNEVDW